ncbi:DUF5644 domain-containing protein [Campylobacter sp. CCS1377]|uniref:DUF5644 domain-containing protein n=1 Tax=Campylobacter sp. CCS1377 TaxID=3158229 RepID=A0AAU7E6Z4_9BACT|nr:DUF5644 domain-containing protein [Campylobacter jejuni]
MKSLQLRLFRFDQSKDYESYYKPYVYDDYEKFNTLYDLFLGVQEDDIYFDFEKNQNAYIFVNKTPMQLCASLKYIVQKFGLELVLEPLSTKRAKKDFIFDKSDFLAKFDHVASLVSSEDKRLYENLEHFYYTSEILAFHPEYMGDALFYFVFEMIEKYPDKKMKFLKIISDTEKGIFYHIKGDDIQLESAILSLQEEILKLNMFDEKLLNPDKKIKHKENNCQKKEFENIKHYFENFNIGCYGFKPCEGLKTQLLAKFIDFENADKNSGYELLNLDSELAYKMAANIVLDAYDSGCDFLVVDKVKDFYMFDTCAKKLMQVSGRNFEDFYILNRMEFLGLIQGIQNPSLKEHCLKVSLV